MSPRWMAALLSLLVATLANALLVVQHFAGMTLPGCGPSSACAQLAAGPLGAIGIVPISFLGLAYFAGVLVASPPIPKSATGARSPLRSGWTLGVIAVGACVSLFYLGVMAVHQKWCVYCVTVHIANLIFFGLVLVTKWREPFGTVNERNASPLSLAPWLFRFAGCMVAVLLILVSADRLQRQSVAQQQRAVAERSADRVVEALNTPSPVETNRDATTSPAGFAGRHWRGPERSSARLVIFQDYQCGDCRKLESLVQQMLSEDDSLHVSIRQFPLCDDCNPEVHYPWFHPEACQAAYVAEAAGSLAGEQGFWIANDWLFERKAKFTDVELSQLAERLSIPIADLLAASQSDAIRKIVATDVDEGISLGIGTTPFVFLNGIAIEGVAGEPANVRLALDRLSEALAMRRDTGKPVARRSAGSDPKPIGSVDRIVTQWQNAEPLKQLPDPKMCRTVFGNPAGPHRVILFQEPCYADVGGMWKTLNDLSKRRSDVRIEFYVYPMNAEMNETLADWQKSLYPHSAKATRILVAAQESSDDSEDVRVMNWLAEADWQKTEEDLLHDVIRFLFRVDIPEDAVTKLHAMAHSQTVIDAIASDLNQAKAADVSWGPTLIINGKPSPSDNVSAETIGRMLDDESPPPVR